MVASFLNGCLRIRGFLGFDEDSKGNTLNRKLQIETVYKDESKCLLKSLVSSCL